MQRFARNTNDRKRLIKSKQKKIQWKEVKGYARIKNHFKWDLKRKRVKKKQIQRIDKSKNPN